MTGVLDLSNMRGDAPKNVMREQDQQPDLEEHYRMCSMISSGGVSNAQQKKRGWRQRKDSTHI